VNPPDQPIYLDSNIFIFALEAEPKFGPPCSVLLRAIDESTVDAVTSELTLAEVLVKPIELGRSELAKQFMTVFTQSRLRVHPVSRAVLLLSAEVRAIHGGRLADSIHVATAIERGCAAIVSEDRRLRPPPALQRISADDFILSRGIPR
jgi:predicted nucleic acid-binding protein